MKDHLAQLEQYAKGKDSLQAESELIASSNAQRQLLEEAHLSNRAFEAQHADICKEKHQLRSQAAEIEYLIRLLTQEVTHHERAGYKVQAILTKEKEIQTKREQDETRAVKIVSDDVNAQVVAFNSHLRVMQA